MNNKGFSLTELIVTFAVLAVILGIAFPAIDNLYAQNKTQIYETYEKGMKTAAKLYVDQYDVDLWDYSATDTGSVCVKIKFYSLKCEGLIKDFAGQNKTEKVDEENSFVYAIKEKGKVKYETYLVVKSGKNGNGTAYKTKKKPIRVCEDNTIERFCTLT